MDNFNLKKFLVENKLTANSRLLNENTYSGVEIISKDQILDALKKVGSTVTVTPQEYGGSQPAGTFSAEEAAELLWQEVSAHNASTEKPEEMHAVLETDPNDFAGKPGEISIFLPEVETYIITRAGSGRRSLNENLAAQSAQEYLKADSNGVSIAEFVKAMIDQAAEFNGEEAIYYDLDPASRDILTAIGRTDLIGESSKKKEEH